MKTEMCVYPKNTLTKITNGVGYCNITSIILKVTCTIRIILLRIS